MSLAQRAPLVVLLAVLALVAIALLTVPAHHFGASAHSGHHQVAGGLWDIVHPKG